MRTLRSLTILVAVLLLAAVVARAQQPAAETVTIGAKSIRGIVSGPQGREAGVWVIAETTQLPTKFARIVVTDDQGRYLIPDLPQADYSVFARGYGLVNSPKIRGKPGQRLDIAVAAAPSAAAAAHYYPAIYWYSLLNIPNKIGAKSARCSSSALDHAGGEEYLVVQSKENPKAFMSLVGRLVPQQLTGKDDAPLIPERAADPDRVAHALLLMIKAQAFGAAAASRARMDDSIAPPQRRLIGSAGNDDYEDDSRLRLPKDYREHACRYSFGDIFRKT